MGAITENVQSIGVSGRQLDESVVQMNDTITLMGNEIGRFKTE